MSGYYPAYQPRPPAHQPVYTQPQYLPAEPARPSPATYSLCIDQGPERAKLVAKDKAKDRKPIDPPPIVRCVHSDSSTAYNPYLFCSATLFDAEKDEPKHAEGSSPLLVGSTVSSAHRLKSLNNDEGTFFVFGDIAPCCQGPVRLHFVLYEFKDGETRALANVTSEPFDVSNAKEWDGVKESTVLSRTFADQGVKLRLKKESRNGRRTIPPSQYQVQSTSQAQLLPQLQPQPQFHSHPHHGYPPQHYPQSTASWDDDEDETASRGSKRQRLSYASGASYGGYASSSQTPLPPSHSTYPPQDPHYGYGFQYSQRSSQAPPQTPPQPYSQSPGQHYSPQQFSQYRRQSYYATPQQQPQSAQNYGSYAIQAPSAYSAPTYAPVGNPQQSFEGQDQPPSYPPSQPQLTLPPMRQAPPPHFDYQPPNSSS
ncbi:MAG: hypothetical protein Q9159_000495 [Coniocarpon cinnabarinum]